MDFRTLPDPKRSRGKPITLKNLTVPACLLGQPGHLISTDLSIEDGRITDQPGTSVDMQGAMVFPGFIDMHTHLDKGHIWARSPNPNGTFMGALETVQADREARWSRDDVRRRMDFSLRLRAASSIQRRLFSVAQASRAVPGPGGAQRHSARICASAPL